MGHGTLWAHLLIAFASFHRELYA